ncbi:MAG: hypothetical protein Q4E53_02580 [Eubacteriales bacterium]|nr:hypothetical protein [Eubacteriales bacterium]
MKENQTQPKSFRITEETAAKLKEIASTNGKNQQETLAMLISTYEMQGGKEALPDKKDEIEKFQGLINIINRMYLSALEDSQGAREIAKSLFEAQLSSKDTVILDLQKKQKEMEERLADALQSKQDNLMKINDLEEKIKSLEENKRIQDDSYEKLLAGKEELLTERTNALGKAQKQLYTLQDKMELTTSSQKNLENELKQVKKELKVKSQEAEEMQAKLMAKEIAFKELEVDMRKWKEIFEDSKKVMEVKYQKEMDLQIEKSVYETKQQVSYEYEKKIEKLTEEREAFREKYYHLLEQSLNQK